MLFFVCGKAAVPVAFPQTQATHFLHEVLWANGYRVNSLPSTPTPKTPLNPHTPNESKYERAKLKPLTSHNMKINYKPENQKLIKEAKRVAIAS